MPEGRDASGLRQELHALCAGTSSVHSALEGLLEVLASRLHLHRSMAVAEVDGRVVVRTRGGAHPDRAILEGLLSRVRDLAGGGAPRIVPQPVPFESSSGVNHLLLPFGVPSSSFLGALVVDEDIRNAGTLLSALDEVAPAFARVAEIESVRTELEEERERAAQLTAVLDSLPDPVVVLDSEERLVMANRRGELLFHASQDDAEGRRHAVGTNNLFFSAYRARSILGEGTDGDRELVLVDPVDGSDLLCEVMAVSNRAPERTRSTSVYVLRDITDLKRAATELESHYRRLLAAEHRLRRETERLNVIIENAGVPILVTDDQSDIVLVNKEAERLFAVGPQGGAGSTDFSPLSSNDATLTSLISDFLLQTTDLREEEVTLVEPGRGRTFPARVTLTKIATARREPTAVVSVLHDLTSEVENQALAGKLSALNAELEGRIEEAVRELADRNRQLEEQRARLAEASRLKTEFLAMMSHELRTPLNAIMGYGSLLAEGLLGEVTAEQRQALSKVRSASEHLLSLINDILDLSKVEAGRMALTPEDVSVDAFVAELDEAVRHLVEASSLEFRVHLDEDLPVMRVDPTRLHQVLLNLISNALKFTEEGYVEVRATRDEESGRVRWEVEDTGIGIEKENLDLIFEEFRQLASFHTRAQKGTGLGLAISRKLVALMDGRLDVRSTVGEGTTFSFTVPIAGETAGAPAVPAQSQVRPSS